MEIGKRFHAEDREAWRAWLAMHHDREPEIWLVRYKKHTGVACVGYDASVEEALCFGWVDGLVKRVDDATYVTRFTPRRTGSGWSVSNKRRVEKLMAAGRMTPAGLAPVEEAKRSGAWDQIEARENCDDTPEELAQLLAQDGDARAFYDGLTVAQRRTFNRWVGSAKRADTRARRARQAAELCARGEKPGM